MHLCVFACKSAHTHSVPECNMYSKVHTGGM